MILPGDWHREAMLKPAEGVGTGAGEGATGQDTGTAWVTRSEDCPEAPAQAHPLCDDCNRPVSDDDAGPSCGSHNLHQWCSTRCRDCIDEQRQVDEDARADREWGEL